MNISTIKRTAGVPIGSGGADYKVGATTPLERDRATSDKHLHRAGAICGHCNGLATQIKAGLTARESVQRDLFETREARQLIDSEYTAAVKHQHIGAFPAGQIVSG